MKPHFLDKVLDRLGRIDPENIHSYLTQLAKEKGFLQAVFNAIQEGVLVTDARGRIKYLNYAATQLLGLREEGALGVEIGRVVRGLDWAGVVRSDQAISRDIEVSYPEKRYLNVYIVPLDPDRQREDPGYAIILRDLTEHRRFTEEAVESEKVNALMLLSASVAHELGNPLNSLAIHIQLMERELKKFKTRETTGLREELEVCKGEIQRLQHIISQYLDAMRPHQPDLRPQSVNDVVTQALTVLRPELANKNILVERELGEKLPQVLLDREQFTQVLYNLIRNAMQAMKTGGILRVATTREDSFVVVSLTDNGGGIAPETLANIFQPFYTTKKKGSGLGLMIVRRIVQAHGGEISIESHLERGTTVKVLLPDPENRIKMLEAK
ncbi:MAG: ATP-binding protein [Verrucomicrobiae bacterium]|nr:ATP-binding protein [Verrucomicrobiae bacterium]